MIKSTTQAAMVRWFSIVCLCFAATAGLHGQATSQAKTPSAGDLREEQRQIGNAYLGDADFQLRNARERLGLNNYRLAQQSGLWALEQLAYAKNRLKTHAAKIESATGIFGRVTESTRKDLRASYAVVRERYVSVEEKIEVLADALKKAGWPILSDTLEKVRNGDDPVAAVSEGLRAAGISGKGGADGETAVGGTGGGESAPATTPSTGPGVQLVPGGVMHNGQRIPGEYNAANNTVTSPEFGTLQLGSVQTNANGVSFYQTDKGVWMTPPGILIAGAKLNPDGTITFADGSTSSIDDVKVGADGRVTAGRPPRTINPTTGRGEASVPAISSSHNGHLPAGTKTFDQDGKEVTITRPFKDGVAHELVASYLGAVNTILQREDKVELKIVSAEGSTVRVKRTTVETRTWSLRVDFKSSAPQDGKLTGTITVIDAAGASGLEVGAIEVSSDDGQRATVQRGVDGGPSTVTFTKSGDYTAVATGSTEWGSAFKIEAILPIGL